MLFDSLRRGGMKALLIIDMQNALCKQTPLPFAIENTVANITLLKHSAAQKGYPVILIQHEAPGTPLEKGTTGWQIIDALEITGLGSPIGQNHRQRFP
ncbi:isochorismatase family protein [Sodalis praecaptivus]|uniref:isochorismatase family protein n=1 Tax=Sodalis praecaptivus TaxID=1239307 RepID=UPI00280B7D12|nr:isochorismatase family protein [Sodalis praecaptivus]